MTFEEHKKATEKDCRDFANMVLDVAEQVKAGNMDAFIDFFWEGGTEEGDAKIQALRENLVIRFAYRQKTLVK